MEFKPEHLLHLFERPTEPLFMPKGPNNTVFDVPNEYIPERYQKLQSELSNRFGGGDTIIINKITLPDLSFPLSLDRRANFSFFFPLHQKMAARLIEVLIGMINLEDFMSACAFCRDRMNPYLFNYALSVALLNRPDTKHLPIPTLAEVFPDKFVDGAMFAEAKEESNIVNEDQERIPITINKDYSASDLEEEHRVAYFREDLGINLHHYHFHLVYPHHGPPSVINKDRRGELFYYMHQQVLARYNFERLCCSLGRVERLNLRDPIAEGYFPKMNNLVSSRSWPPRNSNATIRDINRVSDRLKFDIEDLERWRDRIYAVIDSKTYLDADGKTQILHDDGGIEILGNIVESSGLSPNEKYYGDLHNLGHVAIGFLHDPDNRHLETFSVIGDSATAMRDPVFYRWHASINEIFVRYKSSLPPYSVTDMNFPGIEIKNVEIVSKNNLPSNELHTFWQQSDVDLTRGLDFQPRGSIYARFTHLQHNDFFYDITVDNNTGAPKKGTIRIFLAPALDERGLPMRLDDQISLFIEMDKFTQDLSPGTNKIKRYSTKSSVTIPFERTFRNLDQGNQLQGEARVEFDFCGCGWPHHLLVPKGHISGKPCQLFVMVTDFETDKVEDLPASQICNDAASYCGIRDRKYPDKKPMGFPFDRPPPTETLDQLKLNNSFILNVKITFTEKTVTPMPAYKVSK